MQEDIYDVIIIGGGPAGLTSAQYASRAKLKTLVIDKSSSAGALAFASLIENYPGLLQPMPGKDLLEIFKKQALAFGAQIIEAQVIGVNLTGQIKEVYTMDNSYKSKTVIIATGSMGRKASIPGEAEYLGRGVSYCAICDAAFYKGKTVCVLGDSEEAIKEAGLLCRFAQTVYLIAPSNKLKEDHLDNQLLKTNLKLISGAIVKSIQGDEVVRSISIKYSDGKEDTLMLDGVFVYLHGSKPIVDFLQESVQTGHNDCIEIGKMGETSLPGVFAAGDVTCTEVRQVVVSAAAGCLAALAAEKYIFGRQKAKPQWHR